MKFNEPVVLIPDLVDEKLRAMYPGSYDREHGTGTNRDELPFKAIREGIVNALAHRRWDLAAKGLVFVDDQEDLIVIESPGAPLPPVTVEILERLEAKRWPRNAALVDLLGNLNVVEESNLGMQTFRELSANGWPRPVYFMAQEVLHLTLFRTGEAALDYRLKGAAWITDPLRDAWAVIRREPFISTALYMKKTGLPRPTAIEHLRPFIAHGWLEQDPATTGPRTRYRVVAA